MRNKYSCGRRKRRLKDRHWGKICSMWASSRLAGWQRFLEAVAPAGAELHLSGLTHPAVSHKTQPGLKMSQHQLKIVTQKSCVHLPPKYSLSRPGDLHPLWNCLAAWCDEWLCGQSRCLLCKAKPASLEAWLWCICLSNCSAFKTSGIKESTFFISVWMFHLKKTRTKVVPSCLCCQNINSDITTLNSARP